MNFGIFMLVFFVLILIGMPIAYSMITLSFFYVMFTGIGAEMMAVNMFTGMTNFVLLAIPLFILTAEVMDRTKISDKMFRFANDLVGYIPGGLGHVNVVTSVIFAGMSGAAVADVSGIGHIAYSEMVKARYPKYFSAAVTMSSSLIGPIIPPSIPVIIYSMATGASAGGLLLGGVTPGLLMAGVLMIWVYTTSVYHHYPKEKRIPWVIYLKRLLVSFIRSIPALLTPVILLFFIYQGITTTTEAAAVAVIYSLLLGLILYRTLSFRDVIESFKSVFKKCGPVLLAIPAGKAFGFVLTNENVQQQLSTFMMNVSGGNKWIILSIIMLIFFILGMLSDPNVNIMLFGPMCASIAVSVGFDPIHLGILIILNAMIGNITPPVGNVLLAVCSLEKLDFIKTSKATITPIILLLIVIVIIAVFPSITTWLPSVLMR